MSTEALPFCSPGQLAEDADLRHRFPIAPRTRSGVVKAIKAGRIPASRVGANGRWVIDLGAYADSLRYRADAA